MLGRWDKDVGEHKTNNNKLPISRTDFCCPNIDPRYIYRFDKPDHNRANDPNAYPRYTNNQITNSRYNDNQRCTNKQNTDSRYNDNPRFTKKYNDNPRCTNNPNTDSRYNDNPPTNSRYNGNPRYINIPNTDSRYIDIPNTDSRYNDNPRFTNDPNTGSRYNDTPRYTNKSTNKPNSDDANDPTSDPGYINKTNLDSSSTNYPTISKSANNRSNANNSPGNHNNHQSRLQNTRPKGLAISQASRQAFCVYEGSQVITVTDLNSPGSEAVIVNTAGANPRAIVVDDAQNVIYWTREKGIDKADKDGSSKTTVYTNNDLSDIDGLSIDVSGQRLFFSDSGQKKMHILNLNTNSISQLSSSYEPIDISFFNDKLYFLNISPTGVFEVNNYDASPIYMQHVTSAFTAPRRMHVVTVEVS
eukprot:XP_011672854.1 PREDICTED: prolow-density lipoprotein receptor-related protein 1-like [Strongylocentrotus purpuratus]